MHPLAFITRRILLAVTLVHMSSVRHTGLFLFIGCTLGMPAYVCNEHQWKDRALNTHHIINECYVYAFCLFLVYFSVSETSASSRSTLGIYFIGLFITWMAINVYLILR